MFLALRSDVPPPLQRRPLPPGSPHSVSEDEEDEGDEGEEVEEDEEEEADEEEEEEEAPWEIEWEDIEERIGALPVSAGQYSRY